MAGRRKKIEEIIILLVRTLLLLALLMALSGPVLKMDAPFSEEGFIVFLVDDSLSMQSMDGGVSPSKTYRAILADALSFIRKPARVALVYFSGETHPFTHNYREISSVINRMEISFRAGSLPSSMDRALRMLEKEKGEKVICLFTDMQKNEWDGFEMADPGKKGIKLIIFDTGHRERANIGINRMYLLPGTSEMAAEIQNRGEKEAVADILISGSRWQRSKTFTLTPGARKIVRVEIPETSGRIEGRINYMDILAADNVCYFSTAGSEGEKVLLLGEDGADSTFYIKKALKAAAGEGKELVHVPLDSPALKGIFPEAYSAVFISGSGSIPGEFIQRLLYYAREGGNIVCFPGSRVVPAGFNTSWQPAEGGYLMPAGLKASRVFRDTPGIGWISDLHPFFLPLRDTVFEHTRAVFFRQLFLLEDISGEVLMKTPGRLPLLVEKREGKGSVFLFAFPAEDGWTNLHLRPFFPVLLSNMLTHFSPKGADTFTVGEEARIKVPQGTGTFAFFSPGGEKTVFERAISGEALFVPGMPGFWLAEFWKGDGKLEEVIPVNIDPAEGDLERISPGEIGRKTGGAAVNVVTKEKMREFLGKRSKTREISFALFNAALFLLLLETALSSFFHRKRSSRLPESRL